MELQVDRDGVVVPSRIDPRGVTGPTRGQARGPGWRRSSPGMYVPATAPTDSTDQRIVEAVAGAPAGTALTGWAALHWQGGRWFGGRSSDGLPLPVPLALDDHRHLARRPGVRFHYDWLFEGDLVEVDGLPLTRPERSVCSAALRARSFEETVQVIDLAAADDLISLSHLTAYAAALRGRPHTRRLFSALAVAQENVWSPMEVTLRLRWLARREVPLLCNPPLFSPAGQHLFTPDVFDPVAAVAGEYDGLVHDESRVRRRDLRREELARSLGIEVVSMVSGDLRDVASFERRLDAAYYRSRGPTGGWTLTPPPWWVDTSTVACRRALSEEERRRWLESRAA